jgi:hypothetical protein
LISHWTFELFIMLVIVANTVVLALDDPTLTQDSRLTKATDPLFLGIYTAEACLKILGLGFFFPKGAYIKDNWNKMDFAIVISAWMSLFFSQGVNLAALKAIRVLRPLRSISNVKGLRQLFLALIYSMKMLVSSVVVLVFFFYIFAIAGLQLYMGVLHNRCLDLASGTIGNEADICGDRECGVGQECVTGLDNPSLGVMNFDNIMFALLAVFQCVTLEGWTAIMISLQKALSRAVVLYFIPLVFIGAFFLVNLTLAIIKNSFTKVMDTSRELTEPQMDSREIDNKIRAEIVQDDEEVSDEYEPVKVDSEVLPDFQASFQAGNLLRSVGQLRSQLKPQASLAPAAYVAKLDQSEVVMDDFDLSYLNKSADMRASKLIGDFSLQSSSLSQQGHLSFLSDVSFKDYLSPSDYRVLGEFTPKVKDIDPVPAMEQLSPLYRPPSVRLNLFERSHNVISDESDSYRSRRILKSMTGLTQGNSSHDSFKRIRSADNINGSLIKKLMDEQQPEVEVKCTVVEAFKTESSSDKEVADGLQETEQLGQFRYEVPGFDSARTDSTSKQQLSQFKAKSYRVGVVEAFKGTLSVVKDEIIRSSGLEAGVWSGVDVDPAFEVNSTLIASLSNPGYSLWKSGKIGALQRGMHLVYFIVISKWFNYLMTLFVVLNTCVLAMDHYGISKEMDEVLTNLNLGFTLIFCVELGMKLIGLGVELHFKDRMSYFDLVVVVVSLIELSISGSSALTAIRTIRVFRILRVLRVVRIFRYLQSMSMIMRVIGRTLSQFIYLAMLLLLFTLIFTLIGMQIFGGKFNFEEGKPRANFDSFFSAFLCVFQLMTVENWHLVMYNGIRAVGPSAALYFVSWVFLGNFVLLNLFLAILLDSFNQEVINDAAISSTSSITSSVKKLRRRKEEAMKLMDEDSFSDSSEILGPDSTEAKPLYQGIHCARSYYLFSQANPFRLFCYSVTSSPKFEWGILGIIILNTCKLVWDTYLLEEPDDSKQLEVSRSLDLLFTIIFSLEFVLKSVSMGFFKEEGAYLKESWNKLDFLIVVVSVVEVSISGVSLSSLKVLRLLRTLRPLRFISHNSSMKLVVTALLESVAAICNVGIVVLIVWLIFAILGMSLFSGKLHYCSESILTTKADCEDFGHVWLNYNSNFDNTFEAIKTLFILSSLEDWPTLMYRAMDTTEVDHALQTNSNPGASVYFLVFVMIGSFFFMNLFIGVVFEKFQLAKKTESSLSLLFMSKEQIFWVEMQQLIISSRPQAEVKYVPMDKFRVFFYKIACSTAFEATIMACIILNMLQMSVAYYEASPAYNSALENINLAFTAVFIVEAFIKLAGFGLNYFRHKWNRFDFFVVTTSILDLSLTYFGSSTVKFLRIGPQLARVIRVLRVSKLFRIVKSMRSITELLRILGYSLPAVLNILSLLLLIYFIYAILGVYLFNSVKSGQIIDDYTNFSNFGLAVITLLRISTGEDWPSIMYDCMGTQEVTTTIYFVSFTLLTNFILLNMFIMVILQQWEILANNPENVLHIFKENVTTFKLTWNKYSAHFKGTKAEFNTLNRMMYELGPELGVEATENSVRVQKLIYAMRIPVSDGCVFYNDFLYAVLKRRYRAKIERGKDKLRYMLMEREERGNIKTLAKLRNRMSSKSSTATFVRAKQTSFLSNDSNIIFTMLILRNTFNAWQHYTAGRKKGLFVDSTENSIDISQDLNSPTLKKPAQTSKLRGLLSRTSTQSKTTNFYSPDEHPMFFKPRL